jgi:preprotein translocase subunit SecE
MGRLKRKRPASTKTKKKKKQPHAAKTKSNQPDLRQLKVATPAVDTQLAANREAVRKKEVPKAIKPSGGRFQLAFWPQVTQFLREVKIELKKVTWPTRKETIASTCVVIILVIIVSAFLGLVDVGLSTLIRIVLH